MSRAGKVGLAGGLLGLVATGAAVGLAAERYAVGRSRLRPDPDEDEPFFALPADRAYPVTADDGVQLQVEEVGDPDAGLTVVFCHGYTQQLAAWHFQRRGLAGDPDLRLVLWDQRSHGRSSRSDPAHCTIDQLGHDLAAVLAAAVPHGPVVLVGHSMGGMTAMALAEQRPELFGTRVIGVALIGTSSGRLAELTFGLPAAVAPLARRVLPFLTRGMRARPSTFELSRRIGTDLAFVLTKRLAFGSGDVSPTLVEFVEKMTADTPADVIGEFYDTLSRHDKLAALEVLRSVPVLVLAGDQDRVTPVLHSRAIAAALPSAELVVVPGGGHMVQLEQPALVTGRLRDLVRHALARPPAVRTA